MDKRASGVLMHVSSLPGAYGIGSFGKEARQFIDFLSDAGCTYWQVLPFTPTDAYNSPYASISAFAGNRNFIDLEQLRDEGLLTDDELRDQIKALGYSVKLDTNGTFPERLRGIVEAGLADRVAMDIKASPENYGKLVGIGNFNLGPVRESVQYLMGCGVDYEFRTTAVKGLHTRADFEGIAQWIAGAKEYYIQEFKDSGDLIAGQGLDGFTEAEMHALADIVRPLVPSVQVRGI